MYLLLRVFLSGAPAGAEHDRRPTNQQLGLVGIPSYDAHSQQAEIDRQVEVLSADGDITLTMPVSVCCT